MTVSKIAVSLPAAVARHVRASVRAGRAASVSAYVLQALEEKSKLEHLAGLLDEMLAESGGSLSADLRRAADRLLGPRRARSRRRRG